MTTTYHDGEGTFGVSLTIEILENSIDAMSISPSGRDIVLASRKGLLVVDLDNPYEPPRSLNHLTSWNVADVQWNVHQHRTNWVASTSNQKLLVWNLDLPSKQAIEHVLHGHTRAITDINWSAYHPEILASCSVDSFVHCWDLRDPRKPINAFSDWKAGATQVKWNRQNEHIIASSHERFLRIWDDRKGAIPLTSIEVANHSTKIYGIDFNRTRETGIISCSLDKSIKFWDYALDTKEPEQIIRTTTPVWRARHTPMGWGLVTLPQRGDNSLYLWDRRGHGVNDKPFVHRYSGHTDQVKEFLWRSQGGADPDRDDRQFQLVTWSKDQTLRLWPITNETLARIGHDSNKPIRFRQTRRGAPYMSYRPEQSTSSTMQPDANAYYMAQVSKVSIEKTMTKPGKVYQGFSPVLWMRGVRMNKNTSLPHIEHHTWSNEALHLGEEFPTIELKFPKVKFEEASVKDRTCTVSLQGPWSEQDEVTFLRLRINFPNGYPLSSIPLFQLESTNAISASRHADIIDGLNSIAERYKDRSRPSLEALVRFLLGEDVLHEKFEDELHDEGSSSDDDDLNILFPFSDGVDTAEEQNVPLPRSCAAVFCGTKLVVFFSGMESEIITRQSTPQLLNTALPRSQRLFPSFGHLHGAQTDFMPSESEEDYEFDELVPNPYLKMSKRGSASFSEKVSTKKPFSVRSIDHKVELEDYVSLHDFSELMQISVTSAATWSVDASSEVCSSNAMTVDEEHLDLLEAWELAALILEDEDMEAKHSTTPVARHLKLLGDPLFGRNSLAVDLLDYFKTKKNLQMYASLSCVISVEEVFARTPTPISPVSRPMLARQKSSNFNEKFLQPGSYTSSKGSGPKNDHFRDLALTPTPTRGSFSLELPHSASYNSSNWLTRLHSKGSSGPLPDQGRTFPDKKSSLQDQAWQYPDAVIYREQNPPLLVEVFSVDEVELPRIDSGALLSEQAARSAYACLLHKLDQPIHRAEILKHNKENQTSRNVDIQPRCANCFHTAEKRCTTCHGSKITIRCAICQVAVKGRFVFCLICEHGGHAKCMDIWRNENTSCPAACPCACTDIRNQPEISLLDEVKLADEMRQLWRSTANVPTHPNYYN